MWKISLVCLGFALVWTAKAQANPPSPCDEAKDKLLWMNELSEAEQKLYDDVESRYAPLKTDGPNVTTNSYRQLMGAYSSLMIRAKEWLNPNRVEDKVWTNVVFPWQDNNSAYYLMDLASYRKDSQEKILEILETAVSISPDQSWPRTQEFWLWLDHVKRDLKYNEEAISLPYKKQISRFMIKPALDENAARLGARMFHLDLTHLSEKVTEKAIEVNHCNKSGI